MNLSVLYGQLPSTDRLLREAAVQNLIAQYGRQRVVATLRSLQTQARHHIQTQHCLPCWCTHWATEAGRRLAARQQCALRPVFNLSGTVLHTNLGRAQQAPAAIDAVCQAMRAPVTLEYDLEEAGRGHRDRAIADLLITLTGCEDACIVNNNAAAVLLMLAACADGGEVVVSRGELVEIGGAFRIPDIMRQAGCQLREVGTTNRTHRRDYQEAINAQTTLLMKVHTSNYHIEGFTAAVSEAVLTELGQAHGIPVVVDLGSGSLIDMTAWGLPAEPMPQRLLAAGVSLVSFSGDKLLGGPQAGIIVGSKALIARLQSHPLKRALRADKMTLAALEATLRLYLHPETLADQLPTLGYLTREVKAIEAQARRLQPLLAAHYDETFTVQVEPCLSQMGSGTLPVNRLPGFALTLTPRSGRGGDLVALANRWRRLPQPVIGRIHEGRLWLDLRCLDDENALLTMLQL